MILEKECVFSNYIDMIKDMFDIVVTWGESKEVSITKGLIIKIISLLFCAGKSTNLLII